MPKVCLDEDKSSMNCLSFVCVKCGSENVSALHYPNKTVYRCRDCGFKEEKLTYE